MYYKIAIIELGYVGLPLAVEFAKRYITVGFDINQDRINELHKGKEATLVVEDDMLKEVLKSSLDFVRDGLYVSYELDDIAHCNTFIVTVPTPTDKNNRLVLTPLYKASESVGQVFKKGDYVIYESTGYPGVTEDECVLVQEKISGLKMNVDFFVGNSPERINPGDKEHTVSKILKVTSGSTPEAAEVIDKLYKSIITAGTYKAASYKVAEAAKVIENSQRDINIAFVNELSKIFNRLGIDTHEVLAAARNKWNFLRFKPGLVGGHCIGVDSYYLAQKALDVGYHPEIILAGRRLNDSMGAYVAREVFKLMVKQMIPVNRCSILMLGITFKENCPYIRNTRAIDIYHELKTYDLHVDISDPRASPVEVRYEYGIKSMTSLPDKKYDAIILTVAHKTFQSMPLDNLKKKANSILYDVKAVLPREMVDGRL